MERSHRSLPFHAFILEVKGNLAATRSIVEKDGRAFPILLDVDSFARSALHLTNTPTVFVIDRHGRLRSRMLGEIENLREVLGELVGRLDRER